MAVFARWLWHRAAKAYARRLGPLLSASYGGEPPYSAGQIETAVRAARLDPAYIAIGYAVFCAEADQARLIAGAPKPVDPSVARLLFARYKPWGPAPSGDDWENSANVAGVGVSGITAGIVGGGDA